MKIFLFLLFVALLCNIALCQNQQDDQQDDEGEELYPCVAYNKKTKQCHEVFKPFPNKKG